jgi:hypothetical protein
MTRNRKTLLLRLVILTAVTALIVISANNLPAGFSFDSTRTLVEIDGVSYGTFNNVTGVEQPKSVSATPGEYIKISLHRDFVTDPSLYLWAKNNISERHGLKDVHLVTLNDSGKEISRHILKLCQPLSWSVESSNSALGGFHETVDLAVQEISIY